ncbi:hypothetical protein [Streptomyces thermovulgaris]|uniref:hypothetical protein n=1 Tax=Streptomyces thermovulgaris TaxID=1934 RepID=UPI000A3AA20A|nr:hypothetical protein [Streptomyces thermovulgaris]
MTPEELLTLLQTHHQSVAAGLQEDEREEIATALRELRDAVADGRASRGARAIRRLRRALSSLPSEHPVSRALGGHRYAGSSSRGRELPPAAAVDTLLSLFEGPLPDPDPAADPDPERLLRQARERLLATPVLTEREHAELLAGGQAGTGLIRLSDPRSGPRYPRFQFRPGTLEPFPVVLRINELLRADVDPWGAADWWLGGNSWLQGVPAELLGTLPDEELELAAAELVEAD